MVIISGVPIFLIFTVPSDPRLLSRYVECFMLLHGPFRRKFMGLSIINQALSLL